MSASVSSRSTRRSTKEAKEHHHVEAPAAPIVEAKAEVESEGTGSEAEEMSGDEDEEDEDEDEDDEEGDDVSQVNIDLSNNEFYKGMCTLLEDDNGNNIVQYIDLLCDETKEIADNTKHLESIKNDLHKIAKLFERWVTIEEIKARQMLGVSPLPSSSSGRSSDDASVHTSKTKSSKKH